MNNQLPQRFCTNCGQPLAPGAVLCAACGMHTGAPPTPGGDDALLAGLAAGSLAHSLRRPRRSRRPQARRRGCGCLLLMLVLLAGPFLGIMLTTGRLHQIFLYVAAGLVSLYVLLLLIGMLATRRGREALAEAAGEGCLEALLGGLFGGG